MDIERHDGTKERRYYDAIKDMMVDAEREVGDPQTKKLTLYSRLIPKKKRGRR